MAIMAQLLANELLIMTFKELLNETSFEYMSSIYTVCKKWKNLIELVLIEEIEFRLKNKLLIEYDFCTAKSIKYDFTNSSFNIFINEDHYNPYFSNIPENIEKRKIFVNFQYKNNENNEFLVELNLGTLLFFFEKYEIKSEIEWNHKDCMCIYTKEFITIEKLIISLKKMCIILDILDEKLNTDKYQYKCITKKRMFSATLFDIDYIDFVRDFKSNITMCLEDLKHFGTFYLPIPMHIQIFIVSLSRETFHPIIFIIQKQIF
ncbi:unnamed protein product [Rhizophagus irregularis]|nr:unnamed protein product [Rhizophagus irregularis]